MSARIDAMTPGGYGETGPTMTHQTASGGGSDDNVPDGIWQLFGNAVNRWMDVETYRATNGQMVPQQWTGGQAVRSQYLNTGNPTYYTQQGGGINPLYLMAGAVVLVLLLRK